MRVKQQIGKKRIIIAIDGPAASGKSTTARRVAQQLGYTYIDTGAMYRSVTLKALRLGLLDDLRRSPESVSDLIKDISIRFDGDRVLLNGGDVTAEIRDNRVSREVSFISSLKPVRDRLREMQQELGHERGVVMDGRDIGTVVFPDAELKIFLVADARERAKRRYAELIAKCPDGIVVGLKQKNTIVRIEIWVPIWKRIIKVGYNGTINETNDVATVMSRDEKSNHSVTVGQHIELAFSYDSSKLKWKERMVYRLL